MSVTFEADGVEVDIEDQSTYLNLGNENARLFLAWLGFPKLAEDLYGEVLASELAARCRRRLWPEQYNHDPGREGSVVNTPGHATLYDQGRRPGYLQEKAALLLRLAERAADGKIRIS